VVDAALTRFVIFTTAASAAAAARRDTPVSMASVSAGRTAAPAEGPARHSSPTAARASASTNSPTATIAETAASHVRQPPDGTAAGEAAATRSPTRAPAAPVTSPARRVSAAATVFAWTWTLTRPTVAVAAGHATWVMNAAMASASTPEPPSAVRSSVRAQQTVTLSVVKRFPSAAPRSTDARTDRVTPWIDAYGANPPRLEHDDDSGESGHGRTPGRRVRGSN
jgi:hypothetical protein